MERLCYLVPKARPGANCVDDKFYSFIHATWMARQAASVAQYQSVLLTINIAMLGLRNSYTCIQDETAIRLIMRFLPLA